MDNRKIVLIVDDVELNRAFLRDMLEDEYHIIEAANGLEAVELIRQYNTAISVVLLDAVMPEMDGFEVLAVMNQNEWIDHIPVVMISAENSPEFIEKGYSLGVIDYISRPFSAEIVMHRVQNTIVLYAKQNMLQTIVEEQIREREKNNSLMVDVLSTVVEFRNGESGAHVQRIRMITEILLEALMCNYPNYDLSVSLIAIISNAAALHDIGKIMIPEDILNKPGKLTADEFEIMKTHAKNGADMLESIRSGKLEGMFLYAHDICRWHHERWDGRGYPDGLRGTEIPLCAQVVSLADVYDALVSERVYKPPFSVEQAMQMILNGECGMFNPDILDCLVREIDTLEEKIRIYRGDDDRLFDIESISKELISQKYTMVSSRTMALLEEEREKYQSFAALSNEVLFEYDAASNSVTFSEAGAQILNLPIKIDNAKSWLEQENNISLRDYNCILEKMSAATPQETTFKHQCFANWKDKKSNWIEITIRTLWTCDSIREFYGCLGKIVDITEQKNAEQELKILAEIDPLTHLYNRRTAVTKINRAMEVSAASAILYLDLDNFKTINDTLGHTAGDSALEKFSAHILACLNNTDMAARMGGDEFLVYLDVSNMEDAPARIQAFWDALQDSLVGEHLYVSIGAVICPKDETDFDGLVFKADTALYQAKKTGKNKLVFWDDFKMPSPSS